jgi:hypothetical protein
LKGLENSEIARLIRDPESFQLHISQLTRTKNQNMYQEGVEIPDDD